MASIIFATITSNTTATLDYAGYLIDASTGQVTLTIPDMTGYGDGGNFILVRTDLNQNVNVVITPTNTTINGAPYLLLPIRTAYTIDYSNSVWTVAEACDALLTNNYKFDYNYFYGTPTIYSAFEDIMDILSLTCYDDVAVLSKVYQTISIL